MGELTFWVNSDLYGKFEKPRLAVTRRHLHPQTDLASVKSINQNKPQSMKSKYSRNLSIFGAIVFTASAAHGQSVTQTANDVFGTPAQASFIDSARWSNRAVPSAGNTYSSNGWVFRTPAVSTATVTFAGDSLSVDTRSTASGTPGPTVITKGTANQTISFPNLIMNGGIFSQGEQNTTHTLAGLVTASATSGFSITDGNRNLFVSAPISGAGRLHVGSFNSYNASNPNYVPTAFTSTFAVSGNNSSFSGGWTLGGGYDAPVFGGAGTYRLNFNASGITFRLGHANALGTGTLELNAGILNLNGFSPTGLAGVSVPDAASATILTAGNTLTATAVSLGTTTGAILKIDNAGLANPAAAPISSTTLTVNGPSTIGVSGTGLSAGTFPLIAHTGPIAGTSGFAGITLALPPGVNGIPLDNPGSLDVQINSIEFIKWTNGAATGNWNIATDVNWKTATDLIDSTYQQNAAGGHSVLFNESESETSPVAINIPATVSPNAITVNNPTKDYNFSGQNITGSAAFVKDGAGTVNFANTLRVTGGNTINLGKVVVTGGLSGTTTAIAADGTLEYNHTTNPGQPAHSFTGGGSIVKSGAGTLTFNAGNSTIALAAGGLIDVQGGKLQFGNFDAQGCSATANQSDMNIASGAIFDGYAGNVAVDSLTGSGTYQAGYFGPRSLTVGINGGSSTFSGTIKGNGINGDSQTQLVKRGNGTLTLTGTVNARGAYGGSSIEVRGGTVASPSTLNLSPTDPLSTTGYTGGRVHVAPANSDVAVLNQTAGTVVTNTLSIGESGQATYDISGGTINTTNIELAYNGGAINGPATLNVSGTAQVNLNNNGSIQFGQFFGRPVTVNQSGGQVVQFSDTGVTRGGTGTLRFNGGNQNLTWNLSGGTLSLSGISWLPSGSGAGGGNGVLNLNGGILQITNAAFAAPTGDVNGKPKVAAKVLGDESTPDSGAIIDNYGLAVTFAAPIQNGGVSLFDGGLSLATSVPGGSLTLSGVNTYTGDTNIAAANTLVLADNAELAILVDGTDATKITGAGTATLAGDFRIDTTYATTTPGTEWTLVDVTNRTFDPVTFQVIGFTEAADVWTFDDGTNVWTFTESTGKLKVTAAVTGGYAGWIGDFTVSDPAEGADPDFDGIDNLLEFVLNGNPSISDSASLPDLVVTATHYEFTFTRRDDSTPPETTQIFQYGTDLIGWTDVAVPLGSGTVGAATFDVTDGSPADTVKVSILKSLAQGGKLFGRLKVTKP
jgi:hypothetical protein